MSKTIFRTPATLTSIKSRVDRSYTLTFSTQELDPISVGELSQNLQAFGEIGFAVDEEQYDQLDKLEIPDMVLEEKEKSPSERMRAVLFVLYKEKQVEKPFDTWYREYMEVIINQLKAKLPPQ